MTDEIKRGPGRPPKQKEEPKVICTVLRDYWPTDDDKAAGWPETDRNRVRAGAAIEVSVDQAFEGIESGLLARVK
jgi:hypothetical protein